MKRLLIILFILTSIASSYTEAKSFKRIGLVNPTSGNIEKVLYLIHHDLIKADSFQIVGVVHKLQERLLKNSYKYAQDHNYNFVSFEVINNDIPIDSLFYNNGGTADFLKIFKKTDAMLFFGGDDIPPKIYGEKTFVSTDMIPEDQNWELSFMYHLTGGYQSKTFVPFLEQRPDYLIIGICLGMQEMNVAAGGTLYQDVPYQIYNIKNFEDVTALPTDKQHKNYWNRTDNSHDEKYGIIFHHIKIDKKSYLNFDNFNGVPLVASVHHQAVKKLGKNYKVIATSMDKKVTEAMINTKYKNVYGIQFHTDVIAIYNDSTQFNTAPNKVLQLDKESVNFNANFWRDFSKRLNAQK